jgi:hypothetical protein
MPLFRGERNIALTRRLRWLGCHSIVPKIEKRDSRVFTENCLRRTAAATLRERQVDHMKPNLSWRPPLAAPCTIAKFAFFLFVRYRFGGGHVKQTP